jgi:hypothetical protein
VTTSLQPFPSTAEEFYRLRDDRTNLYSGVVGDYHAKAVRVTAHPGVLRSLAGQVMLIVSVNLLARWCRRVVLAMEDQPLHVRLGPAGSLLAFALASMKDADPFGDFSLDDARPHDLHLHIGDACPSTAVPTTVLSARGWYAAVGRPGEPVLRGDSANPIGGAAAAILGAAQVFRDALGRAELYGKEFLLDAFSARPVREVLLRRWEEQDAGVDLGRLLMVGAGSVGSAAAYFMHLFGLRGWMRVVDGDVAKVENISRSPVFGRRFHGWGKARAVKEALSGGVLEVEAEDLWWREYKNRSLARYDIVIPVANEQNIRWELQNSYPPLMVHAATGRNWNVNFGRHIPGVDDCLADRFAGFEEQPVFTCATGKVAVSPTRSVDASLPFLSFFAGFSIATDLVRLGMEGYPHTPNYGDYSFRKNRFTPQLFPELPREECVCHTQAEGFWHFQRHSRYSHLSPSSWS